VKIAIFNRYLGNMNFWILSISQSQAREPFKPPKFNAGGASKAKGLCRGSVQRDCKVSAQVIGIAIE